MKKYKIELNEKQILVLETACELITRIGVQQYEHIFDAINNLEYYNANKEFVISHEDKDRLKIMLRHIVDRQVKDGKNLFFAPLNSSRGITNECTPETSKIACDLYQTMRYVRSWANAEHKPELRDEHFSKYLTVNYDEPMSFSKQPLIKMEEITDDK